MNDLGIRQHPDDWKKPVFWRGAQHFHDWREGRLRRDAVPMQPFTNIHLGGVSDSVERWPDIVLYGCGPQPPARRLRHGVDLPVDKGVDERGQIRHVSG